MELGGLPSIGAAAVAVAVAVGVAVAADPCILAEATKS